MNIVIIDIPCQSFAENASDYWRDQMGIEPKLFFILLAEKGVR